MKRSTALTWDQLRVGLLIVFALGVVGIAIFKLGQATNLFADRYKLVSFLPSAGGIVEGGQVTVAGQLAGIIDKIEFLPVDPDTTRNLKIILALDEALRAQVRQDSRGHIRTLGLLGDKVFDITPGTPRFRTLREGDTVVMAPSLDYEQLLTQASAAMGDFVILTRDLRKITAGISRGEGTVGQLVTNRALYDELNSTLSRASGLMARMQNPNGTFGRLLDDPALYRSTVSMLTSLDTVLVQLKSSEGTLGKLLRDDSLYTSLVGTVTGANVFMRQLAAGNGTVNRLITDPRLYDELVRAVADLNAILADVRRDPNRYTKGLIKLF